MRIKEMHMCSLSQRPQGDFNTRTAQQSIKTADFNSSTYWTSLIWSIRTESPAINISHEVLPVSAVWSISQRMATLQSRRQFSSLGILSSTSSSLRQPSLRNCCTWVCTRSVTAAYLLALECTNLGSIQPLPQMEYIMYKVSKNVKGT